VTSRVARAASHALAALRSVAVPFEAEGPGFDALLRRVADARFVLLGEASHGTHEFYLLRARLTRRLIEEHGFRAVAIEGDWPDAYRVNRWVRGHGADANAADALGSFRRFPTWMWRNSVVLEFVEWLHGWNAARPESRRTGFYGLDLYSLYASMEAVLRYLDDVDPVAARRARDRYACFERFRDDAQHYGYATSFGATPSCEQEVLRQLREMRERAGELAAMDGRFTADDHFHAEQNARLVRNAEAYYRSMFRGRVLSWNVRDRHMAESLDALTVHLAGTGPQPVKVVVWAHNSHLGDARATEMGDSGEWNLGQLVRERHGTEAALVGFTTWRGTVTAADDWDQPARRKNVRPALAGSYESLFHEVGRPSFLFVPPAADAAPPARGAGTTVPEPLLERAIGVIYRPETERQSHYFEARISRQFDAVVHVDETRALEPLERTSSWEAGEPPETYPTGL
jgi:erythromycin esterase-like protein